MKKVLYVFGSLRRDGAQLRTLEVCRALREQHLMQFDFCVLGRQPIQLKTEVESIGGMIHLIPVRSPSFPIRFSNLLHEGQYDIVESEPELVSGVVLRLAQKQGVPIRIAKFWNMPHHSGGIMSNALFVWLGRTLVKHSATHVVGVSRTALDSMFPRTWQSSCDRRVIYSGLPLLRFHAAVERREVREEFGWPLDSQLAINVARFFRQKNHKATLEATRRSYERNRNVRLLLVGDGELLPEVTQLIQSYGLMDVCSLAGVRTDVPRLLLASDVFLFPSLWEGLPGALLEALAAGLPTVTSDIAPIQEIAECFPSSILMAPPNDAEKLAQHVLQALDRPADRAKAQEHFAGTPFTIEHSIERYSALYGMPYRASD